MKNVLQKIHQFLVKHYSVIFVCLVFIAIIIKQIYYVGMSENNYHFAFKFFYGLKQCGWLLIVLILTYALLFSFSLLFNNQLRYIWIAIIYTLSLAFVIGDLAYTRFFQGPSSLFWKIMPHNSNNNVTMSMWVHYAPTDAFYFVDAIIIGFMLIWGFIKHRFTYHRFRLVSRLGTLLTTLFMVSFLTIITSNKTINSLNATDKTAAYGNFIYHMIDIAQLPSYNDNVVMSSSDKSTYLKYETKIEADEALSTDDWSLEDVMKDSNLIVLQMEAIESFVAGNAIVDSNGVSHEITPNINKLLNHSVQMNTIEQVHLGNSSDCDLMFMTGQYPVSRVISFNQYENSEYLSLAEALESKGYKTSYLNGAYGSTWNYTGVMDSTIGFNEVHYGDEILNHTNTNLKYDDTYGLEYVCGYINDNSLLRYEEEILSSYQSTDKFYNHIVLCSSHIPYELPDILDEAFLNNDKKLKKSIGSYFYNYISLAHYVDSCIGRFIDNLEASGVLDNTSLVIMGDHGGIHKYMSNRTQDKLEGKKKYKWTTSGADYTVLSVLYNKNINGHYVIGKNGWDYNFNLDEYNPTDYKNSICGQVDLLPTLSYMLDIEDYFYYVNGSGQSIRSLMGRNMLKTSLSFAIKANYDIVGSLPKDYKVLKKGKYLSNQIIKSEYYGKKA